MKIPLIANFLVYFCQFLTIKFADKETTNYNDQAWTYMYSFFIESMSKSKGEKKGMVMLVREVNLVD